MELKIKYEPKANAKSANNVKHINVNLAMIKAL